MFFNETVLLRIDEEKDFIILSNASLDLHSNNIVIECSNNQSELLNLWDKYCGLLRPRRPIHLVTQNYIIILYAPYIEELKMDMDSYGKVKTTINIISDHIENFKDSKTYIRRYKIKKIQSKLNG